MIFPDRLGPLIARLEAGQPVTQGDLRLIATLQVLDIAKIGEDFVRDKMQRERDRLEQAKAMEVQWRET